MMRKGYSVSWHTAYPTSVLQTGATSARNGRRQAPQDTRANTGGARWCGGAGTLCVDVPDGEDDGGKESEVEFHCGFVVALWLGWD